MSGLGARFDARSSTTALLLLAVFSSQGTYCLSDPVRLSGVFPQVGDITVIFAVLFLLEGIIRNAIGRRSRLLFPFCALRLLGLVSSVKINVSHYGKAVCLPLLNVHNLYGSSDRGDSCRHDGIAFISSPQCYGIPSGRVSSTGDPSTLPRNETSYTDVSSRTHYFPFSSVLFCDTTTSAVHRRQSVLCARRSQGESDEFVNYYNVLSLPEDCSEEDIKAKHDELTESLKSLPSVDRRIKQTIKEAYKVLSNPTSRAMYDQKLKQAASQPVAMDYSDEVTDEESDDDTDVELLREPEGDDDVEITLQESPNQKRGGLAGFFGNLFGFNRDSSKMEKADHRSGDISTTLNVELRDLVFGGVATVNVDRYANCPDCNVTKRAQGEYLTTCSKCRGRGMISKSQRTPFGYISTSRSCVSCNGRGISRIKDCAGCNNTGRVHDTSAISLDIPAGTKAGSTFKVKGRGHSGGYFARPGNLFVKVVSSQSNREYIENDRVYTCVDLDYVSALLGGTINVETFCGSKQIDVPPGTQHGDELLLGNYEGMKHLVKLHITLPKSPSEEEISLLRKISELRR